MTEETLNKLAEYYIEKIQTLKNKFVLRVLEKYFSIEERRKLSPDILYKCTSVVKAIYDDVEKEFQDTLIVREVFQDYLNSKK